ncbi:glycosyltransferase family 4 protein [Desulfocurvus sp. DL9XJH121]
MNGKRVLLVSHLGFNLSRFRRALILALAAEGAEVHAAVPRDADAPDIEALGAVVHHWPLTRGSLNPLTVAGPVRALRAIARDVRPHLAHSFTHQPNIFARLALGADTPLVNSVTGLGSNFLGAGPKALLKRGLFQTLYRATGSRCRAMIFQNRDDLAHFRDRGLLGRSAAELVRGTGVDTRALAPGNVPPEDAARVRAELGLDAGHVVFTLAARLIRDKGVFEFLEAARALAPEHPLARFVLAGDADPGNPTSLSAGDLTAIRASGNVIHAGWRDDMPLVWAASDVAVLPSYREGLPVSLQEAMACGLPVVTSDAPGCREVLDGERNGLAAPPRDARALALAMGRLAGDESLRRSMGRASLALARERFDASALALEILAIHRRILEETS